MAKAKKLDLFTRQLTTTEFATLKECMINPFEFSKYIKLVHPKRGKVSFDLYPFQKSVLYNFLMQRFNIILKFRQAGITELISLYCLWLAMYHPNKTIVIISIKDRVAKKVLRKIKFMYVNLPDYLKCPVTNGRGDDIGTSEELEFQNGSLISSVPTTEEAGRGEAVSLMVVDEAAIVRWIGKIWASSFPTLATGGAAIVNSTPYGVGNWYHRKWVAAMEGDSEFNPIRLKWDMHPERDIKWYREMSTELGPQKTAQEIDGDFLSSGNTVFDLVDIKAIEDLLTEHLVIRTESHGKLKIYKEPVKGEKYYLGADIATGRANDFSAFSVMNAYGEEYASFKGKIGVFQFAELIGKTGLRYNHALVAPETDGVGLATVEKLQENSYPNLYYHKEILKDKKTKKPKEKVFPGWQTNKETRPLIINELEEDIRNSNNNDYQSKFIIKDPDFCREAYTFIYNANNKPIAMGSGRGDSEEEEALDAEVFNDDSIMAKAITNRIRKTKSKSPLILPR